MPSQAPVTFASNLKALMEAKEIGAERLALISGVSRRLISKYRAGQVEPRTQFGGPSTNAHRIACALGVATEDLLPDATTEQAA